jgi:hypothetical protein
MLHWTDEPINPTEYSALKPWQHKPSKDSPQSSQCPQCPQMPQMPQCHNATMPQLPQMLQITTIATCKDGIVEIVEVHNFLINIISS